MIFKIENNCFQRRKLKWKIILQKFITGLQINLYLKQLMEIQLFATFFQRRK
jgi:hypothetical protein